MVDTDSNCEERIPMFHNADALGPVDKSEVLIVGDSLTSDSRGGNNAEILTCWYNPKGLPVPESPRPTYVVTSLEELRTLL